jgi:serine/threonine protein kinase
LGHVFSFLSCLFLDLVLWTDYVATRWYRAPELLVPRTTNYSTAIDLWSCGCIFAEMILRKPLFPGDDTTHQLSLITEFTGKPDLGAIQRLRSRRTQEVLGSMPMRGPKDLSTVFPPDTDPAVLRLIRGMLEFDPDRRMTAREALMDDYFTSWRDPLGFGPPPRRLEPSEFEFEKRIGTRNNDGLASIRRELLMEICSYHPSKRAELLGDVPGSGYDMQSPSDMFGQAMENQHHGIANRAASMPKNAINNVIAAGDLRDRRLAKLATMPEKELAKYKANAGASDTMADD